MNTDRIISFRGPYGFLSNFHPSPVTMSEIIYPTVEHAFQAAKTFDHSKRLKISMCDTPGKAKRMGRSLELREDWDVVKDQYMFTLLQVKFWSHAELAEKLIDTFPMELIEGNYWGDTYWGVYQGKGENRLGKMLMKVREELIENGF